MKPNRPARRLLSLLLFVALCSWSRWYDLHRIPTAPVERFTGISAGSLAFEPNQGQADPCARFLVHGRTFSLFLTDRDSVLALSENQPAKSRPRSAPSRMRMVRVHLEGTGRYLQWQGEGLLPGVSNYFIGNDPKQWRVRIPHYARVEAHEVYPGIDMVYYGREGRLEYDFIVKPGGDPSRIGLAFESPGKGRLDNQGNLVLVPGDLGAVFQKPRVYQGSGAGRREVKGRYVRAGKGRIGFELGPYDKGLPLVIDPVLAYSTYLGGSGNDAGYGVAVDGAGNAYVVGSTSSANFPLQGPYQGLMAGTNDAFVTKVNPNGNGLVYSTYLGGSVNEAALSVALDGAGNAYVTGSTTSGNFPVVGAIQPVNPDPNGVVSFVTKLNSPGTGIIYSTYLGGTGGTDDARGIAVDGGGNAYVTGDTDSANFPTLAPIQPSFTGINNAFVSKINAAGNAFAYSTFLGGTNGQDEGRGIAVDGAGNAYVTGIAGSSNFPTVNPVQAALGGPPGSATNAFLTKVNAAGTAWVYSTFLGGNSYDGGLSVAVDGAGNAVVAGYAASANFPLQNPLFTLATMAPGVTHAFLAKFNPAGNGLVFSTAFGGNQGDVGRAVALDAAGNPVLAGETNSTNFPLQNPIQAAPGPGFVAQVNAAGSVLLFSTYISGLAQGVVLDANGDLYAAGYTGGNLVTTAGAFQTQFGGGITSGFTLPLDAFALKIGLATATPTATSTPTTSPTPTFTAIPQADCANFTVSVNLFHPSLGPVTLTVSNGCLTGDYSMKVFNSAGEHVRTLGLIPVPGADPASPVTTLWDGKNKYGDECASGTYIFFYTNPQHSGMRRVILIR